MLRFIILLTYIYFNFLLIYLRYCIFKINILALLNIIVSNIEIYNYFSYIKINSECQVVIILKN